MSNFKQIWKQELSAIESSSNASSYFLLNDLLREKDPKFHSFVPCTNVIKLANGRDPWYGLKHARSQLKYMATRKDSIYMKLLEAAGVSEEVMNDRISSLKI